MQGHAAQSGQFTQYAITAVFVVLVIGLRLFRMRQTRRLRLETLWVVPAIYLLFAAFMFTEFPPTSAGWLICFAGLALGGAIGWQRGKLMKIEVDPETHSLNQGASPAAMLFIIVLIAIRFGARQALAGGGGYGFHVNAMLITDLLIAFALGLFAVTRLEMYLRAKRLLEEARAVRA
ncbi:MAG: hypothetical protein ABI471_03990 [Sphingomonas bacterium]